MDFLDWVKTLPTILPDGSLIDHKKREITDPNGFYLGSLRHVEFCSISKILQFIEKMYENK